MSLSGDQALSLATQRIEEEDFFRVNGSRTSTSPATVPPEYSGASSAVLLPRSSTSSVQRKAITDAISNSHTPPCNDRLTVPTTSTRGEWTPSCLRLGTATVRSLRLQRRIPSPVLRFGRKRSRKTPIIIIIIISSNRISSRSISFFSNCRRMKALRTLTPMNWISTLACTVKLCHPMQEEEEEDKEEEEKKLDWAERRTRK